MVAFGLVVTALDLIRVIIRFCLLPCCSLCYQSQRYLGFIASSSNIGLSTGKSKTRDVHEHLIKGVAQTSTHLCNCVQDSSPSPCDVSVHTTLYSAVWHKISIDWNGEATANSAAAIAGATNVITTTTTSTTTTTATTTTTTTVTTTLLLCYYYYCYYCYYCYY